MKHIVPALLVLVLVVAAPTALLAAEDQRPNIVLVLADDVGFSDLGVYGSEISTPNIDRLALDGVIFSNFHASPICAPSRAMLMTGVDSHLAGVGNLPETTPPEHRDAPGYKGELNDNVMTIAERLRQSGYHTYMTGKWHLGHSAASLPSARGFERTFALDATGGDNWEKRPYIPLYETADWFADGQETDLPDDFYSSRFLTDKMIEFIDESVGDGQPFFAYLAYQAVHIPVQAPKEFVDRYAGVYDQGWDALRETRFGRAIEEGLVRGDAALGPMPGGLAGWDSLSEEEQKFQAKSMAVNAGMLEAMDFHLGRLISHLEETGLYDNTVFLVLSDNGADPSDPLSSAVFRFWLDWVGYSTDYETLGEKGTFTAIGPQFASAAVSPGAYFKFYAGEGGLRVPLIVSGPQIMRGGRTDAFSFITDIAPTILELASADSGQPPAVHPISGTSLKPLLTGGETFVHAAHEAIAIEAAGSVAVFKGEHKLTRNGPPFGDNQWRLYNISRDPGETADLSAALPERVEELLAEYAEYSARVGVLEVPEGYQSVRQVTLSIIERLIARNLMAIIVATLLFALLIWWSIRRFRQRLSKG